MRINTNMSAINTYGQYTKNNEKLASSMEKLSSGQRINSAADDAAGLAVSEEMRAQIKGLEAGIGNAQMGMSYLQTAEGNLQEVNDILARQKELSVQYATGTYSTEDKDAMEAEFDALAQQITDITGTTVGTNTTVSQEVDFNGISVYSKTTTIAMGSDGSQTIVIEAACFDTFASVTIGSTATIDAAISQVNAQRATYGAQMNQIEHAMSTMSTQQENITAAESRIRDVDMAKEMMEYTKYSVLVQSSQSMLGQANAQPQSVLSLLG